MTREGWRWIRFGARAVTAGAVVVLLKAAGSSVMQGSGDTGVEVAMILAIVFGAIVWAGAAAKIRAVPGVCGVCGYDLAGLPRGAVCPECGEGG